MNVLFGPRSAKVSLTATGGEGRDNCRTTPVQARAVVMVGVVALALGGHGGPRPNSSSPRTVGTIPTIWTVRTSQT